MALKWPELWNFDEMFMIQYHINHSVLSNPNILAIANNLTVLIFTN